MMEANEFLSGVNRGYWNGSKLIPMYKEIKDEIVRNALLKKLSMLIRLTPK